MDKKEPWWEAPLKMVIATLCIIAILLATAQHPSADEIWRGLVAGGGLGGVHYLAKQNLFS